MARRNKNNVYNNNNINHNNTFGICRHFPPSAGLVKKKGATYLSTTASVGGCGFLQRTRKKEQGNEGRSLVEGYFDEMFGMVNGMNGMGMNGMGMNGMGMGMGGMGGMGRQQAPRAPDGRGVCFKFPNCTVPNCKFAHIQDGAIMNPIRVNQRFCPPTR